MGTGPMAVVRALRSYGLFPAALIGVGSGTRVMEMVLRELYPENEEFSDRGVEDAFVCGFDDKVVFESFLFAKGPVEKWGIWVENSAKLRIIEMDQGKKIPRNGYIN